MPLDHLSASSLAAGQAGSYRAELCSPLPDDGGALIDWLIGFAFDTLGASKLELRVVAADADERCVGEAP